MTAASEVHLAVISDGGVATCCFAGDCARQVERQLVAHLLDEMEWRLHPEALDDVQRLIGDGDHASAIAAYFAPHAHRWDAQVLTRHVVPFVASPLAAIDSA